MLIFSKKRPKAAFNRAPVHRNCAGSILESAGLGGSKDCAFQQANSSAASTGKASSQDLPKLLPQQVQALGRKSPHNIMFCISGLSVVSIKVYPFLLD